LRRRCLAAPKYGQDEDRADRHAVRVLEIALGEIERACSLPSEERIVALRCLETDMGHIRLGRALGATPDGRLATQPISENTSPSPGACVNGLTAMFRSVAKLPLDRIHSGALNVRLQPCHFAGEEGLSRLAQLLRAYFDMGGLQVQLSFADVDELRDAQRHPECHRDLMVRITGYSAAFVDMTPAAQEEIIRREEMGF
jgi:formate C-acetyltransferase